MHAKHLGSQRRIAKFATAVVAAGRVHGDAAVALGVSRAIGEEYALPLDDSVDVLFYQVLNYCPRHLDNLIAIGQEADSGSGVEVA